MTQEEIEKPLEDKYGHINPCPFCGQTPILGIIEDSQFIITCVRCSIRMKHDRRDKVIGHWNARICQQTEVGEKDKEIERLISLLESTTKTVYIEMGFNEDAINRYWEQYKQQNNL